MILVTECWRFSGNTKMNSIGGDVLAGINKAIELAEKNYKGLVIANEGPISVRVPM
jgi:hypothetical protein